MSEPKQLLIIDDDPDFVAGIKSILVKAKYAVDTAYNPKDGLQALKSKAYDLLLLDVMMGRGAEGIMIARKLGKDPKLRDLPVLIITGIREQMAFLFPGQAVHPHFVAVDELVEKPIAPNLLLEKVAALLKTAETRKATSKWARQLRKPPRPARLRRTTGCPLSRRSATCCTPRRATRSTHASSAGPARPPVRWPPAASWTIRRGGSLP